ncbi:AAA family ATPase [Stenotrophomonas sp. HITSZ_GD]|uniref:ExeA family protein n=1 Tax=Stenotrophomonas sp. HITSZ_GD TaxID=3037248 RepID=UPI00240D4D24|nr:ExeA family protein [Stenotrophomonas sp. HITSZ_GD]MDG2526199.1 AAA family ATPase [Stenotrophomonas sp. HITSZ_GD]
MSANPHAEGYLQALGLHRSPFPPTPDAQAYFHTGALQRELAEAGHCLMARKGFVLLTGEVGMGKSTFVRKLIAAVEAEGAAVSLVLNTFLQGPQLMAAVLRDFGMTPGADAAADLNQLDAFLLRRWQAGSTSVLIIDDAQNLTLESLELLRLLSSLESGQEKLLQIVLVGQPELAANLSQPAIRQLASRIVKHIELRPFTAEESARYIAFRLDLAGAGGRIELTPGALAALQRHSGGNPRRIHLVMDRCLYGLVARGGSFIDPLLLAAAVAEAGFRPPVAAAPRAMWPRLGSARLSAAFALLLGSSLAMATGMAWRGTRPTPAPAAPPQVAIQPAAPTAAPALARCIDGLGAAPQAHAGLHLQRIDAAQAALLGVREGVCIERRDDGWLAAWHDPRADVRQVQRALSAQAPALVPGFVDGRYGPDTRRAVADFQRRHGLPATGEADALTQLLLLAAPTPAHGTPHVRR